MLPVSCGSEPAFWLGIVRPSALLSFIGGRSNYDRRRRGKSGSKRAAILATVDCVRLIAAGATEQTRNRVPTTDRTRWFDQRVGAEYKVFRCFRESWAFHSLKACLALRPSSSCGKRVLACSVGFRGLLRFHFNVAVIGAPPSKPR